MDKIVLGLVTDFGIRGIGPVVPITGELLRSK